MPSQNSKTKTARNLKDNPLESIGSKAFDQFFGSYDTDYDNSLENPVESWGKEAKQPTKHKQEFKLFNYTEYYEKELVKRQIKELTELIKKEIELIKKADASLLNEVRDVETISINTLPEKPGIYHIRFLEIVLSILRTLRAKIGESKTWMQALISKKKKRGSLFMALSKKKGTQYSLSQELSNARSVQ